ncbi:MAG: O-antigen ligase family protein [Actinobacteria bacterium]|nr:O-antigen ligase family protein [Actinomycetota bacterium]
MLALSPLTNLAVGSGGGTVKPLQLALPVVTLGSLAYTALTAPGAGGRRRASALDLAVVMFVVVAAASSLQALEPEESLKKMGLVVTAAALYFTVLQVCRTRRDVLTVVAGALTGLVIAGAQGIGQQVLGRFSEAGFVVDGTVVQRVQGSFGHPNQYGGYLALLIPLAVAAVVSRRFGGRLRLLGALALAAALPALTFSYVRGAIAALVLGSLVWLGVVRPRAALAAGAAVAIVAVTVAPATLTERFSAESRSGADVSLRQDLWGAAIDIYSERPILGVGLNNFAEGYGRLPPVPRTATQRRLLHQTQVLVPPHAANLYLNVLAEEGIVGILSLLALGGAAIGLAYRGSRSPDGTGRVLAFAVGSGVLVLAFHSMLEVTLLTEAALPLFALLAAVAAMLALEDAREGA